MIRITLVRSSEATRLRFEGRLLGPWVEECEGVWARTLSEDGRRHLIVDLSGVTFISPQGKELLARIIAEGGELRADDVMNRSIIDELLHCAVRQKGRAT